MSVSVSVAAWTGGRRDEKTYIRVTGSNRMDFGLSAEQEQIREEVRRFAENEIAPVAGKHDREESYPPGHGPLNDNVD
jgi:hypothetical protein